MLSFENLQKSVKHGIENVGYRKTKLQKKSHLLHLNRYSCTLGILIVGELGNLHFRILVALESTNINPISTTSPYL